MKEKIKEFLENVLANEDHETTWYYELATHNGKRWALVAAWMDWDDENDWKPYAKLAYQSTNSLMQEYDCDWLMPQEYECMGLEDDSLVDDTECPIDSDADIDWWLKQWEEFKENYVYVEDEDE